MSVHTFALNATVMALATLGLASQAQAASYPVPAGVVNVNVTLVGGSGGGGGSDSNWGGAAAGGSAGNGGAGSQLAVTVDVTGASSVTYENGTAGAGGTSWAGGTAPYYGVGGVGGGSAGLGKGGNGGDGTLVNVSDNNSGSGAGGGGGSASSFNAGSIWAVAGGGGGGGGGSWQILASGNIHGGAGAVLASAVNVSCGATQDGTPGVAPPAQPNNSGGGGGGGGGGFAAGFGGIAGSDANNTTPNAARASQGGMGGGTCYTNDPKVTFVSSSAGPNGGTGAAGNGGGGPNPAGVAGTGGWVSLIPNAVPTLTPGAPGSGEITVDANLPAPVYPPGFTPTSTTYSYTCDNGMSGPANATGSTPITGLQPGTYNCTVIATVNGTIAGAPAPAITTPVSGQATATLLAAPPTGTVTPTMSAGDSTVTIGGTLPTGATPADAANYTVTCNPALPITNPVTTLPIMVPATNGTNYVCSVDANLTAGGTLASNGTANATPQAVAPGAVTPVPTLGDFGLLMLGGLLAAFGLRRRQR